MRLDGERLGCKGPVLIVDTPLLELNLLSILAILRSQLYQPDFLNQCRLADAHGFLSCLCHCDELSMALPCFIVSVSTGRCFWFHWSS